MKYVTNEGKMYLTLANVMRRRVVGIGAIGCLALGLVITGLMVNYSRTQIHAKARTQFDRLADRLSGETERRLNLPVYGLKGARGVYAASKSVERSEFKAYVQSRDLHTEFPGLLAFGFVQRVMRSDIDEFVKLERADDAPDFTVKSTGDLADLFIIKFSEPRAAGGSVCGIDMGTDPQRRAALEHAMFTGEPTTTSRLTLFRQSQREFGFLYIVPVYRNGTHPVTPDDRRASLAGFLCAPIVVEDALVGIAEATEGKLDLEIFDGIDPRHASLMMDLDRHSNADSDTAKGIVEKRMFGEVKHLRVGNRDWSVRISTLPKFEYGIDTSAPWVTGICGILLSAMLAMLIWTLGRARARAVILAESMTRDLAVAKNRAEDAAVVLKHTGAMAKVGGWDLDLLTEQLIWSDEVYRIHEVEPGVPVSLKEAIEFYTPEARVQITDAVNQGIVSGNGWDVQLPLITAKGNRIWVRALGEAIIENGRAVRLKGAFQDITLQHRMVEELASERARLSTFIEHAPAAVAMFDRQMRYIAYSNRWIADYSITVTDVIGRSHYEIFSNISEKWKAIHERCLAGSVEHCENDVWRPMGWNHDQHLRWEVRPWFESDGTIGGVVMFTQDITSEMKTLRDLSDARLAAESASQSKSEFLANMSHEIRTPLTAILGYADLLRDDQQIISDPQRRAQTIDTIRNAGQHLLTVINDILDLSKIEAGKMTVESVETPLVRLLLEVQDLASPRAKDKGLRLETRLRKPIPDRVFSDPTRLRQILMNLVGNAVKFTQTGDVGVNVWCEGVGSSARLLIDIEDTGPGMSAEYREQLFAAFSQADATVTRHHGGTGLGLAISRRLARLMGGELVLVRSELGIGSCFRVDLPLIAVDGALCISQLQRNVDVASSALAVPASGGRCGRLMLAEDGIDNQMLISFYLKKAGHDVSTAVNGVVALEMIDKAEREGNPYDLLLTDMQMPEMDGYTLAATLRRNRWTAPIIALTAHAMAEDRTKCIAAGCDEYISKPIDRIQLIEICTHWIAKSHLTRSQAA